MVTVPYRTPELALVAGIDGSAYLVVTRTLPAGEPGVVQVWRNAGRSWTRLVDYSRSISSTPKFTTAVGEPNGGILLADGSAGGQVVYDTGRSVSFQLPGGRGRRPAARPGRAAPRRQHGRRDHRGRRSPADPARPPGRLDGSAASGLSSNGPRAVNLETWPGRTCSAAVRTRPPPPAGGWSPGSCSRSSSGCPRWCTPPAAAAGAAGRADRRSAPAGEAAQATQPIVVSVAAGSRWAYALVAHCGTRILHDCDYRVHRRDLIDPGWEPTPVHVTGRTTTGLDVTMRVTPDDHVLLAAGASLQVSDDGGDTVHGLHLRTGPPVDALPPRRGARLGAVPDLRRRGDRGGPGDRRAAAAAAQPAFTGYGLRLARVDGDVLWVAQVGPSGGLTAVSADRGRTWRTIPLAVGMVLTDPIVLASIPGGGAYLVGRRPNDLPGRTPDRRAGRQLAPDHPGGRPELGVLGRGRRPRPAGRGRQRQGLAARAGRPFTALPGTPGYLGGGRVLLGLPSTPGTVELSLRRRLDLAVGAAGLTDRGARGLGEDQGTAAGSPA